MIVLAQTRAGWSDMMPGFFLTLVAALLSSLGGRDQVLVAQLAGRFGGSLPLLAAAWLSAAITCALAAFIGIEIAPMLPGGGKRMLVALALVLASLEMLWRWARRPPPQEPTRSFVATSIVLVSRQVGDAPRFLVFALAIATVSPVLAAVGGTLGNGAALTLGWASGEGVIGHRAFRALRLVVAGVLLVTGVVIGLAVRGLI
jgi:putative Ca2+/H+ antiporter (TMEM165/GDT1 family)